jgi:predicted dehydrogenase
MSENVSRRSFVAGLTAAAAPAVVPALGANDKVNVGFIGTGSRGYYVMDMMYQGVPNDQIVVSAVCDTFQGALARGKDQVMTKGKNTPKTYVDYREMLKDPSIDVIFVTTPEHLHHEMALAALAAGKNIYLEKPIAHTIEEGWDIVKAAEKSGKVVQVGTQNRSNQLYHKAKEMVEKGMIGDCHYVRAFWYRNALDVEPSWRYPIPEGLSPQTADWDKFLGPAKKRPFDARRYRQWRLYWDYSGGISTDLLVHQTDITNFVLNKTVPTSCMASGGIYRWTEPYGGLADDREVPDTISALYEYVPEKFHLNYSCYLGNENYGYGEQFMGNEGTVEVLNRQVITFTPETFRGRAPERVKARKAIKETIPNCDNLAVQAHVRNFIEAVQGKGKVIAPASVGQQAAIGGHMATLSFKQGKKIVWDDRTKKYRFV